MCCLSCRSKIAGTIKRDGLVISKLPAEGRPAKAVLELLRAKEARNIRISCGEPLCKPISSCPGTVVGT